MAELSKFTVTIEFGNEAMRIPADAAASLRALASYFDDGGPLGGSGTILDRNGNTVGEWRLT